MPLNKIFKKMFEAAIGVFGKGYNEESKLAQTNFEVVLLLLRLKLKKIIILIYI